MHYLYPKLDEIKILLHIQPNIDIMCLCETFLNEEFSDNELLINVYSFIHKDSLIVSVKSNLSFSLRIDLETENLETIWFEVKNNKQKPMLISYCYRLPSSTADWINEIENAIDKASSDQRETILLGDFNNQCIKLSSAH